MSKSISGHYTSQNGLIGILSEEIVWATNIKFRNDEHEFQDALESTKEVLIKFIVDFYDLSVTNHLLEKRKQEPTSLEMLLTCFN